MRRTVLAILLALASAAALPVGADADVLVNAPKPSVACGRPIKLGVWYQSFSGGPRFAHITVKAVRSGKHVLQHRRVIWHKNVTATTKWRFWYVSTYLSARPGAASRCGATYLVIYKTAGGASRFHVRVP